jgi:hypothetical protein
MLVDADPIYLDYQDDMRGLFHIIPIKNILEFGLGSGTEFLLEDGHKVTSIELQADPNYLGWFDKVSSELKSNKNWKGIYYECVDDYTDEVRSFVESNIKKPDFVFIDPGVHFRPLIVNSCIKKGVPIIATHDTNLVYDNFPWSLANPNKVYKEVVSGRTTYYFKDYNQKILFLKELL